MIELLTLCGRSLPHVMMMLIPEAWDGNEQMDPVKKAFYEYPCFFDGAMGRAGFYFFYRWKNDWCHVGPKWTAPITLLCYHRRPGNHGFGDRRAAH